MVDGHDYLTRLYTTMSADEMTIDPEFVVDPGLPDVSNVHDEAVWITECDRDHFDWTAGARAMAGDWQPTVALILRMLRALRPPAAS